MTKLQNLIKNLTKANQRLEEALKLKLTKINRDASIQRFEFTFELSWKTFQEYIRDQGYDCNSPKNCIREGAKIGIIDSPRDWFGFLDARNLVAHTYNEELADKIYKGIKKFPKEIDKFLEKIKEEK